LEEADAGGVDDKVDGNNTIEVSSETGQSPKIEPDDSLQTKEEVACAAGNLNFSDRDPRAPMTDEDSESTVWSILENSASFVNELSKEVYSASKSAIDESGMVGRYQSVADAGILTIAEGVTVAVETTKQNLNVDKVKEKSLV
jgi:hypothetical protein